MEFDIRLDGLFSLQRERLEGRTVSVFKIQNVGTVLTFDLHYVGTLGLGIFENMDHMHGKKITTSTICLFIYAGCSKQSLQKDLSQQSNPYSVG